MFFKKKVKKNKTNAKNLPRAVAFVDYEHWFISMEKIHHRRPDIQSWFDDLKSKCNLVEVTFFANFSKFKDKETETRRIRTFTNKIIDTFNPDNHYIKDYTDFIILDNIYQKALMNSDIDTFIIFSGDGHFSSSVAFLRNFCNKQVGIYGVKNCISKNLINNANWYVEVPFEYEMEYPYYNMIFTHLKVLADNKKIYPTFLKTVQLVANHNKVQSYVIKEHLMKLINDGYIIQVKIKNDNNEEVRALHVDWKKISESGIWNKDSHLV